MSKQQQFEDIIKSSLMDKAEQISPSNDMFQNIKSKIESNRSEKNIMLKEKFLPINLNLKKSVIAASCGFFIIAGSVLTLSPSIRASALQKFDKNVNGYTSIKNYNKTPSKEKIKTDLGYEAKLPSTLPNGYKLIDSDIVGHVDGSLPADKQYDKKELNGCYSKKSGSKKNIFLSVSNSEVSNEDPIFKNAKKVTIGKTTAYFAEYKEHILPKDVLDKMSEEEKNKLDESSNAGKEILILVSNKSSSNKPTEQFKLAHSLKWVDNGKTYILLDSNNELSFNQMSEMAQSIINSK